METYDVIKLLVLGCCYGHMYFTSYCFHDEGSHALFTHTFIKSDEKWRTIEKEFERQYLVC